MFKLRSETLIQGKNPKEIDAPFKGRPLENTTLTVKVLIVPCEALRRIENSPRALNWLSHGRCSFEERPFERQQSWFRNINLIACEENL